MSDHEHRRVHFENAFFDLAERAHREGTLLDPEICARLDNLHYLADGLHPPHQAVPL